MRGKNLVVIAVLLLIAVVGLAWSAAAGAWEATAASTPAAEALQEGPVAEPPLDDPQEEEDDEGDEGGETPEPPASDELAYTETFFLDKDDLATTGTNPYFILEPGYRLTLKSSGGRSAYQLDITVLDETQTVDGVETRVLEERETVDGRVTAVSRNYFAISRRTNDVYYFGEDAGGAWGAGVDGARAGCSCRARRCWERGTTRRSLPASHSTALRS